MLVKVKDKLSHVDCEKKWTVVACVFSTAHHRQQSCKHQ